MAQVSFDNIPLMLTPGQYVEFDNSRAVQGTAELPNRVLVVGSMLSAGSATAETLVQVVGETDGDAYFGRNSQLGHALRAFKKANRFVEVWAIGLDDAGTGVAEVRTITFATDATSDGVWYWRFDGLRIAQSVANGDTVTEQATALAALINAEDTLWTATSALGVVTLTHRHAAAFGADSDIRVNSEPRQSLEAPGGTTVAFAVTTSGAVNPDLADATAVVGSRWFTELCCLYSDATNIAAGESFFSARWGPLVQQDGMLVVAHRGTFSDHTTLGNARNSQFSCIQGTGNAVSPPWIWAAVMAAVLASETDPARPLQNMELPDVYPVAFEDEFDQPERELLLRAGISTHTVAIDGTVLLERAVTTYKLNSSGLADTSYRNYETMTTLAALRYTLRARFAQKYPRHKLVSDGVDYGPGVPVISPSIARAEIIALFGEWLGTVWVEDRAQFVEELIVERDANDPDRLNTQLGPNLANQFRVLAAKKSFIV